MMFRFSPGLSRCNGAMQVLHSALLSQALAREVVVSQVN